MKTLENINAELEEFEKQQKGWIKQTAHTMALKAKYCKKGAKRMPLDAFHALSDEQLKTMER